MSPATLWSGLDATYRLGLIVVAMLTIASAIIGGLKVAKVNAPVDELVARMKSWWIMAAVFFLAMAVSPKASIFVFMFMSFWALKEYVTLLDTRKQDHTALLLAFLAIPIQYFLVWMGWYGVFIIFIPVYMFLLIPAVLILKQEPRGFIRSASEIQWGLLAFVFGLSNMAMLLQLEPGPNVLWPVTGGVNARALLLFFVVIVEFSDVAQYIWGKLLGKHLIFPAISPNKTWEGLIGGIATALLLALALRFATPFSVPVTLVATLVVAVLGFFGGAVMSAVKRDSGVKDFGRLLPGHGGMLDRVDSICWAIPVFFHFVRYFYF